MTSAFGWLDVDHEQRRRMLEVVDLFREQGTVDELGIGTIRDALANAMFPGTSTLHTRLRYVLFIPWLMQRAVKKDSPREMAAELRELEFRMIEALLAGGEHEGVIGNTARRKLKRLPSLAYWSALSSWGIVTSRMSQESFFRRAAGYRSLARHMPRAEDPEAADPLPARGIDPYLPMAPDDLLTSATFAITPEEEQYLSDRIASSTRGSLLAWLVLNQPRDLPDYVWEIENLGELPPNLARLVDHARRFHTAIDGAGLLYQVLLARAVGEESVIAACEDDLRDWRDELAASEALVAWDRAEWWATLHRINPRLSRSTVGFVDSWLNLIASAPDLAHDSGAIDLIRTREFRLKGARARLANQAALDRRGVTGGRFDLDFRWRTARSHLRDLYAARAAA